MWVSLFIFSSYRRLPEEEFAPQMGWVWKFYEKIKRKFLPPVNLHQNYMLKANFYDPIFRKRSPQTVSQRKRLVLHLRWHKHLRSWIFLKITVHIKLMLDSVLLHVILKWPFCTSLKLIVFATQLISDDCFQNKHPLSWLHNYIILTL